MADRTIENRGGRQEAPEADAIPAPGAPPAAGKAPGLRNPWLPLMLTILAMPMLAYATTRFVLLPQMKKALTDLVANPPESAPAGKEKDSAPAATTTGTIDGKIKQTVQLSKIMVNVAGTGGTRYLLTSLALVGTDPNLKIKIDENHDQLLDLANGSLCTKTISDLEKPGIRNLIRGELMTVFNNALGGPLIKEIYITELAIQ